MPELRKWNPITLFCTMSASFWKLIGLPALAISNQHQNIKQITYRGGLIVFSIPGDWLEQYEPDGGGTFFRDGDNDRTFYLNVITAQSANPVTADSSSPALSTMFRQTIEGFDNGYALTKKIEYTEDRREKITMHTWLLSAPLPPDTVRIANFTYVVLSSRDQSQQTLQDLAFLESSVRQARFSLERGETHA